MADEEEVRRLRAQARGLSRLTLGLLAVTIAALLVPGLIGLAVASQRGMALAPILGHTALIWSPAILYLYAIWALHRAFAVIGGGSLFADAIARGCSRAGLALACGAVLSAIVVPNALRLIHGPGGPGQGSPALLGLVRPDLAYLAVGVVGLALLLLGRLLARAAAVQARSAALEDELGGFV